MSDDDVEVSEINGTAKPQWARRRAFMFTIAAFCMGAIAYVLFKGLDTKPAEAAVTGGFLALLGMVGSYVFGATWEDINLNNPGGSVKVTRPSRVGGKP